MADDNCFGRRASDFGNFSYYDAGDSRIDIVSSSIFNGDVYRSNGRTIAQGGGELAYKLFSAMGRAAYTRLGFWRCGSASSARRNDGV